MEQINIFEFIEENPLFEEGDVIVVDSSKLSNMDYEYINAYYNKALKSELIVTAVHRSVRGYQYELSCEGQIVWFNEFELRKVEGDF